MKKLPGKIYFLGNPYLNGHKIEKFIWSGRIDEDESIWFDFHLETDDYYADDTSNDEIEEPQSNWKAKIVWNNYHSCKMSSTFWAEKKKGIKISEGSKKLNFENCINNELTVDKLPLDSDFDYEDLAFKIYLLGHDSCANHKITIKRNHNNYNIQWTGKIALTYDGDYSFDYDFIADIQDAKFDGFYYPKSWTLEKAAEIFREKLEDFEAYSFVDVNSKISRKEYKLVRIDNNFTNS